MAWYLPVTRSMCRAGFEHYLCGSTVRHRHSYAALTVANVLDESELALTLCQDTYTHLTVHLCIFTPPASSPTSICCIIMTFIMMNSLFLQMEFDPALDVDVIHAPHGWRDSELWVNPPEFLDGMKPLLDKYLEAQGEAAVTDMEWQVGSLV
eukprot:GHUV01035416.1.p1 GENE.GHUV01035416.1~~GHUV01035416.1.p1  ORF type:complete len:152 (-),score=37.30 GHUV01035416.1:806-1261(-)